MQVFLLYWVRLYGLFEFWHCSDEGSSQIWEEPRDLVVWGAAGAAVVFKRAAVGFVLAEDAAEVSFLRWGCMYGTVRSLWARQYRFSPSLHP